MKYSALSLFLFLTISHSLMSQNRIERETISAGDFLSRHFVYLYPSFTDAKLKIKNQGQQVLKMNVNLLLSELEFIDAKGDTLSVANPDEIDSVFINEAIFFYTPKGLMELRQSNDSIKLGVLRRTSFEVVKVGAMGIPTRSAAVTSIRKLPGEYDNNVGIRNLTISENIDITMETNYILFDALGGILPASKSNFQAIFPNIQRQINEQVKAHNFKFNNETHLQQLLDFCLGHTTKS